MAVPVPRGPGFGSGKHRRRTLVLAVAFVLYLAMGGGVFHLLETYSGPVTVERPVTTWQRVFDHLQSNDTGEERPGWPEVKQAAVTLCWGDSRPHVDELLESLHDSSSSSTSSSSGSGDELAAGEWGDEGMVMVLYPPPEDTAVRDLLLLCGNRSYELLTEEQEVPWSFIDAVFFCMTVVTTIGYGHITPRTPGGQVFCIVYSLLGIPISGLLLAGLSDFFAGNLANFFDTKWAKRHGDSKWSLAAFTVLYLLVGFVLFVFVPAVVFMWLEDWTYLEAVYYAFITLSTVGFGDYTAAVSDDTGWMTVYKMVVMVWILVGLGYWVLVLNFLQKTLKSKEVLKTLKSTSRLIAKEADELRSALAEVGLIHRDATFIPEHSKMALSMMLSMSQTLAGTTGDGTGEGGTEPAAFVRGIHSIGDNMRHRGLLAALMASLPPPPPPSSGAAQPGEAEGRVNEGYLSDDNTEEVSSPTSSSSRRQQTETEIETELDTELDAELELETDGAGAAAVMVLAALDCGQAAASADSAAVRDCPV